MERQLICSKEADANDENEVLKNYAELAGCHPSAHERTEEYCFDHGDACEDNGFQDHALLPHILSCSERKPEKTSRRHRRITDNRPLTERINANPALKHAYETLVKDLPEDQKEGVIVQIVRSTRRAVARAQGHAAGRASRIREPI